MNKIHDALRVLGIKPLQYEKRGKAIIVTTKDQKYVIKKNIHPIYEYLNQRTFQYYPKTRIEGDYEISEYLSEVPIPEDQKMMDLISLVALLHTKTTHYKKVEEYGYQDIYETVKENLAFVKQDFDKKMDIAESQIFMSPSNYLLARHITLIYNTLTYCEDKIENWYQEVKELQKIRFVILHNNLDLSHFLENELISWNKAKIGSPIFDLYGLYQRTYSPFVWEEIFRKYNSIYPLKKEEKELFLILISIPTPLEFTTSEYKNVQLVQHQLEYLEKTSHFIEQLKNES